LEAGDAGNDKEIHVSSFICILNYCMKKSLFVTILVLSFSIFFGALAIIITHIDNEFHFQWLSLSLHFFSIATIVGYILIHKTIRLKIESYTEVLSLLFVGLVAVVTRFLYLSTYPFVAVLDEVRDAGLDGVKIVSSSINNIFYYGSYEAHGLIIPTISSFFLSVFFPIRDDVSAPCYDYWIRRDLIDLCALEKMEQ